MSWAALGAREAARGSLPPPARGGLRPPVAAHAHVLRGADIGWHGGEAVAHAVPQQLPGRDGAAPQAAETRHSKRVSLEQEGGEQGQRRAPGKTAGGNQFGVIVRILSGIIMGTKLGFLFMSDGNDFEIFSES